MKTKILCLAFVLMFVSSCAPKTETSASAPPSGTWTGDYGPDAQRRDPVTLKLRWDNGSLRGTVEAGPRSLAVTQALFKSDTGAISIEFDAQGNGRTVHYVVSGKVEGNQMAGSWSHDGQQGDFRVTKQ